jgi:hypothetical protein
LKQSVSQKRKSSTNTDNTSEPSIITSDVDYTSNLLLGDGEVNIQSDVSKIDVKKKNLLKFKDIISEVNIQSDVSELMSKKKIY